MGAVARAIYALTGIAIVFLLIRHSDAITGAVSVLIGAIKNVVSLGGN